MRINARAVRFDVEKMQRHMTDRGWAQVDLGAAAGVSQMAVSHFLCGRHQSNRMAVKLSTALGRTVKTYLLPEGSLTTAEQS